MPGIRVRAAILALLLPILAPPAVRADLPPLIPREVILSGWDRGGLQLSPDGTRLSWLAGDSQLPANIWVEALGSGEPRRVTANDRQGILEYQ